MANVTDHTQAMIDYLVLRWGLNDTAGRAKCLAWLKAVESEIWGLRPWWFGQVSREWVITEGTKVYAVEGAATELFEARVSDSAPLRFLDHASFQRNFGASEVAGEPLFWTVLPLVEATRYMQFEVWPQPEENETGTIIAGLGPVELADSADSISRIPANWRAVLLAGADVKMAEHEGMVELAGLRKQEYETLLAGLVAEDARHEKAGR